MLRLLSSLLLFTALADAGSQAEHVHGPGDTDYDKKQLLDLIDNVTRLVKRAQQYAAPFGEPFWEPDHSDLSTQPTSTSEINLVSDLEDIIKALHLADEFPHRHRRFDSVYAVFKRVFGQLIETKDQKELESRVPRFRICKMIGELVKALSIMYEDQKNQKPFDLADVDMETLDIFLKRAKDYARMNNGYYCYYEVASRLLWKVADVLSRGYHKFQ